MAVKKAKRWCNTKCGRYVSDIDRFAQVENKDRRVRLEDIRSTSSTVEYLRASAQEKNISLSLCFEQIFLQVMFYDLLRCVIIPTRRQYVKKAKLITHKRDRVKFPKIYMHPVFKKLLQEDAHKRRMSLSFYIYHMLLAHKRRENIDVIVE